MREKIATWIVVTSGLAVVVIGMLRIAEPWYAAQADNAPQPVAMKAELGEPTALHSGDATAKSGLSKRKAQPTNQKVATPSAQSNGDMTDEQFLDLIEYRTEYRHGDWLVQIFSVWDDCDYVQCHIRISYKDELQWIQTGYRFYLIPTYVVPYGTEDGIFRFEAAQLNHIPEQWSGPTWTASGHEPIVLPVEDITNGGEVTLIVSQWNGGNSGYLDYWFLKLHTAGWVETMMEFCNYEFELLSIPSEPAPLVVLPDNSIQSRFYRDDRYAQSSRAIYAWNGGAYEDANHRHPLYADIGLQAADIAQQAFVDKDDGFGKLLDYVAQCIHDGQFDAAIALVDEYQRCGGELYSDGYDSPWEEDPFWENPLPASEWWARLVGESAGSPFYSGLASVLPQGLVTSNSQTDSSESVIEHDYNPPSWHGYEKRYDMLEYTYGKWSVRIIDDHYRSMNSRVEVLYDGDYRQVELSGGLEMLAAPEGYTSDYWQGSDGTRMPVERFPGTDDIRVVIQQRSSYAYPHQQAFVFKLVSSNDNKRHEVWSANPFPEAMHLRLHDYDHDGFAEIVYRDYVFWLWDSALFDDPTPDVIFRWDANHDGYYGYVCANDRFGVMTDDEAARRVDNVLALTPEHHDGESFAAAMIELAYHGRTVELLKLLADYRGTFRTGYFTDKPEPTKDEWWQGFYERLYQSKFWNHLADAFPNLYDMPKFAPTGVEPIAMSLIAHLKAIDPACPFDHAEVQRIVGTENFFFAACLQGDFWCECPCVFEYRDGKVKSYEIPDDDDWGMLHRVRSFTRPEFNYPLLEFYCTTHRGNGDYILQEVTPTGLRTIARSHAADYGDGIQELEDGVLRSSFEDADSDSYIDIVLDGTAIVTDEKGEVEIDRFPIRKVLLWNIAEQRFIEAPALGINTDGYEG